ncbi:MAG: hypothetical protein L6Q94_23005 [Calditrichia bacterium]|nr:hypothetical protein [Calditrichia bacterium]
MIIWLKMAVRQRKPNLILLRFYVGLIIFFAANVTIINRGDTHENIKIPETARCFAAGFSKEIKYFYPYTTGNRLEKNLGILRSTRLPRS